MFFFLGGGGEGLGNAHERGQKRIYIEIAVKFETDLKLLSIICSAVQRDIDMSIIFMKKYSNSLDFYCIASFLFSV
jgi:hypothetical protein